MITAPDGSSTARGSLFDYLDYFFKAGLFLKHGGTPRLTVFCLLFYLPTLFYSNFLV